MPAHLFNTLKYLCPKTDFRCHIFQLISDPSANQFYKHHVSDWYTRQPIHFMAHVFSIWCPASTTLSTCVTSLNRFFCSSRSLSGSPPWSARNSNKSSTILTTQTTQECLRTYPRVVQGRGQGSCFTAHACKPRGFPSDCCRRRLKRPEQAETQQLMHISDLGKCVPPESNSTGRSWQSCSDR